MRHSGSGGGDRAERRVAGAARRRPCDRENREHPVAHEFQHLAAEGVYREGDAVEPGVEGRNDLRRRIALGKSREAAQIGEQQRGLDGLADPAAQWTGEHPRRAAPAEIGLKRRRQRRPRGQRGERRGGEAGGLVQAVSFVGGERTGTDPTKPRPVRLWRDDVLMDGSDAKSFEPSHATVACSRRSREPSWQEPQRLDHLAAVRSPEPGAPGNKRMRRGQGQGASRERRAIRDQAGAEVRQKPFRGRRFGRRVNQPDEGCRELHRSIIGPTSLPCHQRSSSAVRRATFRTSI